VLVRFPNKVVVTAPTSGQLFDALFAELKRWINELPDPLKVMLIVKNDRVELAAAPSEAFISARTSRAETPEALAGVHSDNVMLVVDEASGVPEAVFEAAAGSMSGHSAVTIMLSNPTRSSGTFFESQTRLSGSWWTRRWSCVDSPLVSDEFVDEMRLRYGEDSNAFRIRVLGEFPLADDDTIIPFHLVESAMHRDIQVAEDTAVVWGLDVARFGSDKTALARRQGAVITDISSWQGLDLMQTVGRVKAEYDGLSPSQRPREILVDVIGMGGGVVDRLRELGLPVRGVNVGEAPSMGDTYSNLRAELWFKMRGWLEQRTSRLPKNDQLIAELTSIRYSFLSSGKMKAESKDDMRKRGLASPDLADAVCLTLAADAVTALGGRSPSWGAPLRRNLKGVA
jgi:phage terminase large subunit